MTRKEKFIEDTALTLAGFIIGFCVMFIILAIHIGVVRW